MGSIERTHHHSFETSKSIETSDHANGSRSLRSGRENAEFRHEIEINRNTSKCHGGKSSSLRSSCREKCLNVLFEKIFVENERARLTKKLADIYEGQGKIKEAAEILQELQVMSRRSRVSEIDLFLSLSSGGNLRNDGSTRKNRIFIGTDASLFSERRLHSNTNHFEKDQCQSF